jgi:hypothetical protein
VISGAAYQAADIFAAAVDDAFEDGMDSRFTRRLEELVERHGPAALIAIEGLLASPGTSAEVAVEALKWLGAHPHPASHTRRRALVERFLASPSSRVRYGAALGLAGVDDPASLAALDAAIRRERHPRLATFFQLVTDQLEATRRCRRS